MTNSNNIKLILVDDDEVHLDKLWHDLHSVPNISIVGSFVDPIKAVKEAPQLKPDVVLTDIEMPGMSGLKLIQKIKEMLPETELIALTVDDRHKIVLKAIEAGASGYLLKNTKAEDIVEGIEMIKNGGAPLSPKIALLLVEEQKKRKNESIALTGIEQGIVRNVMKGLGYKEIAALQNVTIHTIHWHIKNIYKKLHSKNRTQMLAAAKSKGIS